MNRAKKEEARKNRQAREGLSDRQLEELEANEAHERKLAALAKNIHHEMFPEEYDFMMDSNSDATRRRRGINPMRAEYTERVNARRKQLGVPPLGSDGLPTCRTSWDIAYTEAKKRLTHR